ncbi:MAG: phosphate ABC transporter, permease protein PstA [Firmicutes bacterium GWF2_51_9]|nr:phosphate ABC transporter permease PstA [Erysipelotrichaceae bacterium]OGS54065.1 MAG: phosphate ABC transporter, permease protein PstA [Firmicutes bacterium GWF2_51_9]OGS59378.1 MAG: phosphate ABC transporter, permease protein PstA [Firmicutes bacterium GWE2_51_13]HAM62337.1 phosphate ABC transporter permease PtsA [Erysipelotrichaceae bacterium]HBZ40335.1 phosphate ABC transporter permease PtsA [Erysipelotrichaceae bacterium]
MNLDSVEARRYIARKLKQRKALDKIFHGIVFLATMVGVVFLIVLLTKIFRDGFGSLNWNFLTSFPSRFPSKAGILTALVGSIWIISLTILIALPIGVGTAIYLEEYANKRSKFYNLLVVNIANLAGVPAIVYGMLGLMVFVRLLQFGNSILSGAFTLSLLILPVIIVASQEAIKAVPNSLREASFALGASKWQTVSRVVLPYAIPGILTGAILAVSRAMGEAAPLIMVGGAGYVGFLPDSPMDVFSALPLQIYNWTSRPQTEFQNVAAAGIIVLLVLLLTLNAIAVFIRNKYSYRMD